MTSPLSLVNPAAPHTGTAQPPRPIREPSHAGSERRTTPAPEILESDNGWVDAGPFRALANTLVAETGWHWRVVALAADVPASTLRGLLGLGRRSRSAQPQIRRNNALALWTNDTARLLARGSRHELARTARMALRILGAHRHGTDSLVAMTGLPRHLIIELASGRRRHCTLLTTWRCRAALQAHAENLRRAGAGPLAAQQAA